MHWSAILVLTLAGPYAATEVATTTDAGAFASYTKAWHAAHDAERPMLVILNPAEGAGITADELRSDEKLHPVLDEYVVAVIDTGTEHGKKVHQLFDSAPLPRVVVIDKEQKNQIFRTSDKLSHEKLGEVLNQYKSGEPVQQTVLKLAKPAGNCPNCQRRFTF